MHLNSGLGPGLGFGSEHIHVAQQVVGLCNKGCIRGMRGGGGDGGGGGGGEGVKEGKAVVGWMRVGEAGVQKTTRAGALCCGVPWVFLSKLLF